MPVEWCVVQPPVELEYSTTNLNFELFKPSNQSGDPLFGFHSLPPCYQRSRDILKLQIMLLEYDLHLLSCRI